MSKRKSRDYKSDTAILVYKGIFDLSMEDINENDQSKHIKALKQSSNGYLSDDKQKFSGFSRIRSQAV
ncbi:hypothetical protein MMC22_004908 [Lobaria immixta]|nr:hypothetical protein [Lobaria immixta]